MTCEYADRDGSFVLGALSPTERLEFERHLAGCDQCSRSVRELAGLPGLLARVDPDAVAAGHFDEPVPPGVLPVLLREARNGRRRAWRRSAAAAVAASVLLAGGGVLAGMALAGEEDTGRATLGPGASRSPAAEPSAEPTAPPPGPGAGAQEMRTVVDVPVRASIELERVAWGTRLELWCTYSSGSSGSWRSGRYEQPDAPTYVLVVRGVDGGSEAVGTWRVTRGRTMHLTSGTALDPGEIRSVEVQTPDGRTILATTPL